MADNGSSGGQNKVDLVFEGGGVKGIALVGAYSILEERGFQKQNVAGTSAGAIVGALVAAGYTAQELKQVLEETPFSSFKDKGWEDKIIGLGIPISILKDHGIYEGTYFHKWIQDKLKLKGIETFGDLKTGEEDPRWKYGLQVVVSDVTRHSLLLLPRDAAIIGEDPDRLLVADVVRMSMSIPLFFEPVIRKVADEEVVLVDGGMLSNFPVWVFDSDGEPDWPTFGLKLVDPDPKAVEPGGPVDVQAKHNAIKGLVRYLLDLIGTMTDAHDKIYLQRDTFIRTITISNLGVKATQFDLPHQTAEDLYTSGQTAAKTFLDAWDFDAYKKAFRGGLEQESRRQTVTANMKGLAAGGPAALAR